MPLPDGNENIDMLDGLQQEIGDTVQTLQAGQPQHPDGTPITDPAELQAYYEKLKLEGTNVDNLGRTIGDIAKQRQQQNQQMKQIAPTMTSVASKSFFNLKEAQTFPQPSAPEPGQSDEFTNPDLGQGGMGGAPTAPSSGHSASLDGVKFPDYASVKNALLSIGNAAEAAHLFIDRFGSENSIIQDPDNPQRQSSSEDAIRDPINEFFSTRDDRVRNKVAQFLFDTVISDGAKNEPVSSEQDEVPASLETNIQPHTASIVKETNEVIRKLAQADAAQKVHKGPFNLKKEAQHKGLSNVLMWGPSQVRYDEFTRQPISNWHLVERNKGFGLRIDDICDIDFEAIWRGTIMDKYDVNYIERRFEVDKNIPPTNNYQLKPGQLRRPYLPEYSSTEARLESARDKKGVFNWAKEAAANSAKIKVAEASEDEENKDPENFHPCGKCLLSKPCHCKNKAMVDPVARSLPYHAAKDSKKKVTKAQAGGVAAPNAFELPELPKLDGEVKAKQPQRWCPICYSKMRNAIGGGAGGKNPNECPSCHAMVPTPLTTDPQMGQVRPGEQQKPQGTPTMIQPGTNLASFGGIFYDGNKFIVYSKKKKKDELEEEVEDDKEEFEDYEAAEKFFQSKQPNKPLEFLNGSMLPTVAAPQGMGGQIQTPQPINPNPQVVEDVVEECDIPMHPSMPLDKKKLEVHKSMQHLAIDE